MDYRKAQGGRTLIDDPAFTMGEWLAAIQDAKRDEEGSESGKTVRELAESLGIHENRIRETIAKLQEQGRIVVKHARRTGIDGRSFPVPVYFIIGDKKNS